MKVPNLLQKNGLWIVVFLLLVPTIYHFTHSWAGYNPSDDGFILVRSQRILDGQLAHRDFFSNTPIVSPLIHIPIVWIGGEYTYWLSRAFVWMQFALMAVFWVLILNHFFKTKLSSLQKFLLALLAFLFSSNQFPIMAWYTIDGLFLGTLGIYWALKSNPKVSHWGFFVIGLSYLCKQNFIFLAPGVFLILFFDRFHWKKILTYGFAVALPGLIYFGFFTFQGVFSFAIEQLAGFSQPNFLWSVALKPYLSRQGFAFPWGLWIGFMGAFLAFDKNENWKKKLGLVLLFFIFFAQGLLLFKGHLPSFGVVGVALGYFIFTVINQKHQDWQKIKAGGLVFLFAWCSGHSVAHPIPVLGSGMVLIFFLMALNRDFFVNKNRVFQHILIVLTVLTVFSYHVGRRNFIYCEQPAKNLKYSIDHLFPGTRKIRTNENLYRVLVDLNHAIKLSNRKPFAIIPDFPGYWVKASYKNPIFNDWPLTTVTRDPKAIQRMQHELTTQDLVVLLQKNEVMYIAYDFTDSVGNPALTKFIHNKMVKIGETEFFDLYKNRSSHF